MIGTLLRRQFDTAWALTRHHLAGLTDAECLWRPAPAGPHVHRDATGVWRPDWPAHERYDLGPPSIAWTATHMLFWWTKAASHVEGDTGLTPADAAWPGSADAFVAALSVLHENWRARLATAGDDDYSRPLATPWPYASANLATIAAWANLELMKNAAEIGQLRFLYAVR